MSMFKDREIVRLILTTNFSNEAIAKLTKGSRNTVKRRRQAIHAVAVDWDAVQLIDDFALSRILHPTIQRNRKAFVEPDWGVVDREMRHPGVTRTLLYHEYRSSLPPEGYLMMSEREFCRRLESHRKTMSVTMRQVHRGGECLFLDYSGKGISYWLDDGSEVRCQIFVSAMGGSSAAYAEATHTQTVPDWLMSHVRMLAFYGGAPKILVPDCLKSAVICWRLGPDGINRSYAELAAHYGAVVQPARPGKPKDKGKGEAAVKLVQRWILARLRHRRFYSLEEVNRAIRELLAGYNGRNFKRRKSENRWTLFESVDRPHLRPLPDNRFEYGVWKSMKVPPEYHVEYDERYYSVPHVLVGKTVNIKAQADVIKIYYQNKEVVTHIRVHQAHEDSTVHEHCPPNHKAMRGDGRGFDMGWAQQAGGGIAEVAKRYAAEDHPTLITNQSLRILRRLAKEFEIDRLQAACRRGLVIGHYSTRALRGMLINKMENAPVVQIEIAPAVLPHGNVRGAEYFNDGATQ